MPVPPESDLNWQAFLYVAGELSFKESSDFEERLLDDQTAREAVASAVEMVQLVGLAGLESGSNARPIARTRRRRALVWGFSFASAAAAAVVALALLPSLRSNAKPEADASEIALTWSGIRNGIDADWSAMVAGSQAIDPGTSVEIEDPIETSTERPLPSWLLSAASTPPGESPQEEN